MVEANPRQSITKSLKDLKEEIHDNLVSSNSLSTKQEENKIKKRFLVIEELQSRMEKMLNNLD